MAERMQDKVTLPAVALQNAPKAEQRFGTKGIKPMIRPSATTHFFMQIVAWAERLNLKCAKLGNPPVYDNAAFPWVENIERLYPAIRAELERVLLRQSELPAFHDISTDVKTISADNQWKTFFLLGFGLKSKENIKACPETWRAVQNIPGLTTAMFSILEPGKHLPPHRGPYNGVLRLHLGLIVPAEMENVAIRVEDRVCYWQEGKILIFDDAYEHEAWNYAESTRVVLFIDFVKPLRFPARLVNWFLLHLALFTPFIKEGLDNHRKWEKKFYGESQALRA
ncbi:hypothetical protein GQ53DRAFT_855247 [Thozetella sp. PMI_491]|nr:hypothetical protein GQ53DRAFT_855247 [Thozetella sp. PMI_491]